MESTCNPTFQRRYAPAWTRIVVPARGTGVYCLADLKVKNRMMTCEDSLIAATALFHGHTVATHNKRHFEPAGVQTVDPLA